MRWSPNGRKFAVASVDGTVAIGHFEAENDWWVCRHLRKPSGTAAETQAPVLGIAWHPQNILLAVGTLDGQVQVLAAGLKAVDEDLKQSKPFGTVLVQVPVDSWPHAVAFSCDGALLAWCSNPKKEIYNSFNP